MFFNNVLLRAANYFAAKSAPLHNPSFAMQRIYRRYFWWLQEWNEQFYWYDDRKADQSQGIEPRNPKDTYPILYADKRIAAFMNDAENDVWDCVPDQSGFPIRTDRSYCAHKIFEQLGYRLNGFTKEGYLLLPESCEWEQFLRENGFTISVSHPSNDWRCVGILPHYKTSGLVVWFEHCCRDGYRVSTYEDGAYCEHVLRDNYPDITWMSIVRVRVKH